MTQIRLKQIEQINSSNSNEAIADKGIEVAKINTAATKQELDFLAGLTSAVQTQLNARFLTSSVKNKASVVWTSDTEAATALAIATKITAEITAALANINIPGAIIFKGNWSSAPTTGLLTGFQYIYDSGVAPTGVNLEAGDVLIANKDNANKTIAADWAILQTNIDGAVTSVSNLTNDRLVLGAGGKGVKELNVNMSLVKLVSGVPTQATASDLPTHNHTKSQITDFPTLGTAAGKDVPSSGNATSLQVVQGNDTRLTDARTPVSHQHASSDITGLPAYKGNIIPTGAKNGTNKIFTLPENINPATLSVFLNGVLQEQGSGKDYQLSGTGSKTITFESGAVIPISSDSLIASYFTA